MMGGEMGGEGVLTIDRRYTRIPVKGITILIKH